MIRFGLVGAGPWARFFHAPMLSTSPGVRLAVVWARRSAAAEALAADFGAAAASSFEQLLAECDAVAFTVPPDVQAGLAVQAARAGRHLLLEKPLAFSVAAAEAVADAVDGAGVVSQLVLTNRYTSAVREFLAATQATTVRALNGSFVSAGSLPGSPFHTPWRQHPEAALSDLGPHGLDLLEATAGPVARLYAAESEEVVAVTTRHLSGAVGQLVLSGTTPGARGPLRMTAVTDAGIVEMDDPAGDSSETVQHTVVAEFVRAVAGEGRPELDVHRGVLLQRLLAAASSSLRTGEITTVGGTRA